MFFSYDRLFSVRHNMLMELGLPAFSTLMHNAKLRLKNCCHVQYRESATVSSVNNNFMRAGRGGVEDSTIPPGG